MTAFGKELIIDLHNCAGLPTTRDELRRFFKRLCDEVLDMERADLHFWDYEDDPEGYDAAADHLKGISACQFISTSNIVIHTVDVQKKVFLNVFSCKNFEGTKVIEFAKDWFRGELVGSHILPRL